MYLSARHRGVRSRHRAASRLSPRYTYFVTFTYYSTNSIAFSFSKTKIAKSKNVHSTRRTKLSKCIELALTERARLPVLHLCGKRVYLLLRAARAPVATRSSFLGGSTIEGRTEGAAPKAKPEKRHEPHGASICFTR